MAISATPSRILFGFCPSTATQAANPSKTSCSSIFSGEKTSQCHEGHKLSSLIGNAAVRPGTACPLDSAIRVLQLNSDHVELCLAANSIANFALRPDLQRKLATYPALKVLVDCLLKTEDESVKRFLSMAIGRLASNRALVANLIQDPELVDALLKIATDHSSGNWRQPARTLAIMASKASEELQGKFCNSSMLEIVKNLLEVEQTEIQTDAILALVPFTKNAQRVRALSDADVWTKLLTCASHSGVSILGQLAANVMQAALDCSVHDVLLSKEAFSALCSLSQKCREHSSSLNGTKSNPYTTVICRIFLAAREDRVLLAEYASEGAAREISMSAQLFLRADINCEEFSEDTCGKALSNRCLSSLTAIAEQWLQ
uniref:Armadillo repeat-containing protein 8 n=1 Tax=Hanusia phi TaxID=3032 RepID=A0A7S0NCE8_9CRYP|mmetsp:Transcript_6149/g.14193  ORF Transcript_6149/g.14193 Transcript_6149/m.14193 type:complete len:374 (+) Transcript_6149:139-1260(+)|eukprot:767745-Hanusia_phi.AAC.3